MHMTTGQGRLMQESERRFRIGYISEHGVSLALLLGSMEVGVILKWARSQEGRGSHSKIRIEGRCP